MLFPIYKEIQIGFGKLLNQYKQKTDKIRNMTIFEKISEILEISAKLASSQVMPSNSSYHVTKNHVHEFSNLNDM